MQDLLRAEDTSADGDRGPDQAPGAQADQVTHEVVTRLDRVFITPLDREDIHLLASRLDDIMDLIDGTARRLQIFHAGKPPQGAVLIADVIGKRGGRAAGGGRRRWRRTRAGRCWPRASR